MDNEIQSYNIVNTGGNGFYDQIPVNDKLRKVGIRKFVKHGELIQLILTKNKNISFNISKNFNQTIERFQESATNGFAGLSKDHIKAISDILINPANGYLDI